MIGSFIPGLVLDPIKNVFKLAYKKLALKYFMSPQSLITSFFLEKFRSTFAFIMGFSENMLEFQVILQFIASVINLAQFFKGVGNS